jgi:1-phosphofructokinase
VAAVNTVGAGDAFLAGYLAAAANGSSPTDRLALALRWGATAVQHQGTLFSQVDERIPVFVAAADPSVTLSEPLRPDQDPESLNPQGGPPP